MYMCVQKLCVYGVHLYWCLGWQCNGHVDEHTIDLTRMMQKNLRSSKERAIRSVFHLTR